MNEEHDPETHWVIDKKIPIALIMTIIVQTGVAVWWAKGLDARVEALEKGALMSAPQGDRLVRLETQYEAIRESLAEIKALIRRSDQR